MLRISQFVFNMFGVNTYIVWDEDSRDAVVVDPGMTDAREERALDGFIDKNNLKITQIVNTHMHLDHCFGANYVKRNYKVQLGSGYADSPLAEALPAQASRFGIHGVQAQPVTIDISLHDGDIIKVGDSSLEVISVPGHSPGSIALYCKAQKFVIVGDVLFEGSIGRTDLPGGNHRQLIESIKGRLLTLPDDTVVFPGHGPSTTIKQEQQSNPYIL